MEQNELGNLIFRDEAADAGIGDTRPDVTIDDRMQRDEDGRYFYDQHLTGWKQFDTRQDASYFGVWVNLELRQTFTYAEGDRMLVICPTKESFVAELADAAECYGELPAFAVAFSADGTKTSYYDPRPTGLEA